MKLYNLKDLPPSKIEVLTSRQQMDQLEVEERTMSILSAVKTQGDAFLQACNERYDAYTGGRLFLDKADLETLANSIEPNLAKAIDLAAQGIERFHLPQLQKEALVETAPGVVCWRENRAIEKVGIYVPGGSAVLPSTFLMLVIPARIAGCKEIVVCTPPNSDGTVDPSIAYCAIQLGIERIFLSGGAQAIAAMAYGTETVPKVYKIFGPGNRYVMTAKSILQKQIAIDMPAGPSEVLIIADQDADAEFVASDLLAQAEHGPDSQVILVSNSRNTLLNVKEQIELQLPALPRQEIAAQALNNSYMLYVEKLSEAFEFSNQYAPEHLILALQNPRDFISEIVNAGSVFLGNLTPESAGDYASGTNHTLPTSGFAKAYSGVSVDSFLKKITFQEINKEGLQNIGPAIEILADAEGLFAHKNSITLRLKKNGY